MAVQNKRLVGQGEKLGTRDWEVAPTHQKPVTDVFGLPDNFTC